jgi:hypothetical protein
MEGTKANPTLIQTTVNIMISLERISTVSKGFHHIKTAELTEKIIKGTISSPN